MQMELDQLLHVEQVDSLEQWEQLIHFMIIQMLFYRINPPIRRGFFQKKAPQKSRPVL